MSSSYIIRGGETGRARLSVLSEAMDEAAGSLLDRVGDWTGLRVLDAGCGGGDVSRRLARRVGPTGAVVGIDAGLGRELPRLVGGAGFEIVYAGTVNPSALSGPVK